MTEPEATDWGFTGPDDASRYLADVMRLWIVWIVGLAVLMTNSGTILIVGGIAVIGLLLWFARPIQRRAERLVPVDTAIDRGSLRGKTTTRDRALKAFAYGDEPLRAAVEMTGSSRVWLGVRMAVLALTAVAFAFVLFDAFTA